MRAVLSADELISKVQETLRRLKINYDKEIESFGQVSASERRQRGEKFSINDHLKGLILSMLGNQRPWGPIAANMGKINGIFFDYDVEKIKTTDKTYFVTNLKNIKCGNRSIAKQMESLDYNINIFNLIEKQFGSLDKFVTSDKPEVIAMKLGKDKKFKLKQIGFPLALDYLRNVGIRTVKPDVHMRRIISNERLNLSNDNPSDEETVDILTNLAEKAGVNPTYLDNLLWIFCAVDYGNICNDNPKCNFCLLRNNCNYI